MSDPPATLGATRKEGDRMHKATITVRSAITGEYESVIEDDDKRIFYAKIVGAVEGITSSGAVVAGISFEEVSA